MTQSAQTYKDTQKANSETGECSGDLQPCSSFTSFESTICVDDKNLCPITDVRLVKKGDDADSFIAQSKQLGNPSYIQVTHQSLVIEEENS